MKESPMTIQGHEFQIVKLTETPWENGGWMYGLAINGAIYLEFKTHAETSNYVLRRFILGLSS